MSHIGFVLNLFGLSMSTEWDQGSVITRHLYAPAVKQSRNPVRIPAGTGNPGGENLGGIPAGVLPGSWQDPAKIPVPFLQGLSPSSSQLIERTSWLFYRYLVITLPWSHSVDIDKPNKFMEMKPGQ